MQRGRGRAGRAGAARAPCGIAGLRAPETRRYEVVLEHLPDALVILDDEDAAGARVVAAQPSSTTWPVSRKTMSSATFVTRSAIRSRLWATRSRVTARSAPSESVPFPISATRSSNVLW